MNIVYAMSSLKVFSGIRNFENYEMNASGLKQRMRKADTPELFDVEAHITSSLKLYQPTIHGNT